LVDVEAPNTCQARDSFDCERPSFVERPELLAAVTKTATRQSRLAKLSGSYLLTRRAARAAARLGAA